MNSDHSRYTDFLKDRRFIRWQLMPDDNLDAYWRNFRERHPQHDKEIRKAIMYLQREGLNKNRLTNQERTALLENIQKSILEKKKIKQRKLVWYSSVASVAVALVIIGIPLFYPSGHIIAPDKELIVGKLLNNEDIQLITSEKTISFRNDVEVTLDSEGTAEIIQGDNETSKISIARDKLNSLIVPYGKRSILTLCDGSRVWLNSGSILEFPTHFSGNKREIYLRSGEVYVEVIHDTENPFHVQTNNFNVKVHGTKFNISNYSGSPPSVVLVEGSVSLQLSEKEELFLIPNEQAVYSESNLFSKRAVDTEPFISWKDGYCTFDKTPMTDVLQQIGRYYNLSFNFENDVNLQKRTCTGKIYLSENLDNVMTTIALLTSTKYDKQENRIYITN